MESKLEAYRLRKRRKETFDKYKTKLKAMFSLGPNAKEEEETEKLTTTVNIIEEEDGELPTKKAPSPIFPDYHSDEVISTSDDESENPKIATKDFTTDPNSRSKWFKYTLWMVYFLFWATCYAIAIELKFGIVYLMFSALFGIYFNTRTEPRKKDEISAYSVFNEDCLAINGTLKAEQFENEIRHGFNSVR